MSILQPETMDQMTDCVRQAIADRRPLDIRGRGTLQGLGRPAMSADQLDLSRLSGILDWQPDELMLTARPGTLLTEISAVLAGRRQALAFEPPDWGPFYGLPPGGGSLGGLVSAGLSGPRRLKAGGVRDHVLAVSAVSGQGTLFRAGGKVVKNVTGYDLPKLLTGAFGTLGLLTELTLKVLPAPPVATTLILAGVTVDEGMAAVRQALASAADLSGAAWLPEDYRLPGLPPRTPCAVLRLEGVAESVSARLALLHRLLSGRAALAELDGEESLALWAGLRDLIPFTSRPDDIIWRLSVPPAEAAALWLRLQTVLPRLHGFIDHGGGTVWLALPSGDAYAEMIRSCLPGTGAGGGHATLVRAPDDIRALVPVFQPLPPALARLNERVRARFDPLHLFNRGRITGEAGEHR
jgi:glycolate oxidase FAD binding subunit